MPIGEPKFVSSLLAEALLAAAAKSLQSCPTLCDPRDGSPPGSPVPGILQARTLEWVVICLAWVAPKCLWSPMQLPDWSLQVLTPLPAFPPLSPTHPSHTSVLLLLYSSVPTIMHMFFSLHTTSHSSLQSHFAHIKGAAHSLTTGYPPQPQALWMLRHPLPSPCHPSPCPSHRLTAHIQYFHRALNVTKDYTLLPISKSFWYHHLSRYLRKYAFSIN